MRLSPVALHPSSLTRFNQFNRQLWHQQRSGKWQNILSFAFFSFFLFNLVRDMYCIVWPAGFGAFLPSGLLSKTGLLQTPARRLDGQKQGCYATQQTNDKVQRQGGRLGCPEQHLEPKHKMWGARWRQIQFLWKVQRRSLQRTCATKGVIRAPTLLHDMQVPIAKALVSVGNT